MKGSKACTMNLIFERWKRQQDRPLSVRAKQMNWLQPYLSSISAENAVCPQLISYYFPYYLIWPWLTVHVACYMENDAMSTLHFVVMTKRGKEGTCPSALLVPNTSLEISFSLQPSSTEKIVGGGQLSRQKLSPKPANYHTYGLKTFRLPSHS